MPNELAARRFLLVMLVGATVLVSITFYPLAGALFLGAALAAVLWPLNRRLARKLGKKHGRSIAAGLISTVVVLLILGPLIGLSAFFVKEANEGFDFIAKTARSEGVNGLLQRLPDSVEKTARTIIEQFAGQVTQDDQKLKELGEKVAAQSGKAAGAFGTAVSATGSLLFLAAMMLVAFYCLLAEGEKLVEWLDGVSPLRKGRTVELLIAVRKMSSSVIKSTLITSAVQAGAALVGS